MVPGAKLTWGIQILNGYSGMKAHVGGKVRYRGTAKSDTKHVMRPLSLLILEMMHRMLRQSKPQHGFSAEHQSALTSSECETRLESNWAITKR
jgi:hypothetical protein